MEPSVEDKSNGETPTVSGEMAAEPKPNGLKSVAFTKRDQFASLAMQGLLAGGVSPATNPPDGVLKRVADLAYRQADAMLARRRSKD